MGKENCREKHEMDVQFHICRRWFNTIQYDLESTGDGSIAISMIVAQSTYQNFRHGG